METLTILLLAHNEADTIEKEVKNWIEALRPLKAVQHQIVVVEDGSTDGTTQILARMMQEGLVIHAHGPKRVGYKKALLKGLSISETDFIFMSDTGLKNKYDDFFQFWENRKEYDLIVGHKASRSDSIFRRFLTFGFNLYVSIYLRDSRFQDLDCGFRLLNQNFVQYLLIRGLNFSEFANAEMSLVARNKFRFTQLPITYYGRAGQSRGLPLRKMPKAIYGVILDLRDFKNLEK